MADGVEKSWRGPLQSELEAISWRTMGATSLGTTWAVALALMRGQSLVGYAVPMGTNFFVASGMYFGLERGLSRAVGTSDLRTHLASGTATGAVLGGLFGGLGKVPAGIALMSAMSAAGYGASLGFDSWKARRRREILAARGELPLKELEPAAAAAAAAAASWWPSWSPIQSVSKEEEEEAAER